MALSLSPKLQDKRAGRRHIHSEDRALVRPANRDRRIRPKRREQEPHGAVARVTQGDMFHRQEVDLAVRARRKDFRVNSRGLADDVHLDRTPTTEDDLDEPIFRSHPTREREPGRPDMNLRLHQLLHPLLIRLRQLPACGRVDGGGPIPGAHVEAQNASLGAPVSIVNWRPARHSSVRHSSRPDSEESSSLEFSSTALATTN